MAAESRRVIAESAVHAKALAQNLAKQDFIVESATATEWTLRRKRRRGDITVTIAIRSVSSVEAPRPSTGAWPPPTGPPAS